MGEDPLSDKIVDVGIGEDGMVFESSKGDILDIIPIILLEQSQKELGHGSACFQTAL